MFANSLAFERAQLTFRLSVYRFFAAVMRGGRGGAAAAHAACKGSSTGVCGQGTGGVHLEHFLHGRDFGRVEAQRLVELLRLLPS